MRPALLFKVLSTQGYGFYQLDLPTQTSDPRLNRVFNTYGPLSSTDLRLAHRTRSNIEFSEVARCGNGHSALTDKVDANTPC